MIELELSWTYSDPTGQYLLLPDSIKRSLGLEQKTELFAYPNPKEKELYLCLIPLDRPIMAVTFLGVDEPGVIADIASVFGKNDENITHFASFAMGGSSVTELIFQHPKPIERGSIRDLFTEAWQKIEEELNKLKTLSDINEQFLYNIIPAIMTNPPLRIPVMESKLPLIPLALDQLELKKHEKTREYFVLLTSYVRFPILVAKFLPNPHRIVEISIDVSHEPNVLGPICESLREKTNIFSGNLRYHSDVKSPKKAKARLLLYGDLLNNSTKIDVQEALRPSIDKGIIDADTVVCRLVSERSVV